MLLAALGGCGRVVQVPVAVQPPPCPADGDEMPIAPEGVEVGSVEWYGWHDSLVAWGVRVTVCRARAAARASAGGRA
jgi:hypothetical protein